MVRVYASLFEEGKGHRKYPIELLCVELALVGVSLDFDSCTRTVNFEGVWLGLCYPNGHFPLSQSLDLLKQWWFTTLCACMVDWAHHLYSLELGVFELDVQ